MKSFASIIRLSSASLLAAWGMLHAANPTAEQVEFFEKRIRPVLAQDCYECHSTAGKSKGDLVLDSRPGWMAGGESGAAIKPGDPAGSLLLQSLRHAGDLKMPKNGAKLDDEVLADFEKWIAMGAPDPRDAPPSKEELAKETDWNATLLRRKNWWSFQPVTSPPLPKVKQADWSKHPVDQFILAKLEENQLEPAAAANPSLLLRRLSYVLTGLPPTPEEVAAFKAEHLEATVDRLLQSPRFGETWARHWMDWVRYAESYGSEGDPPIPYAFRYRDYLIRAFNADVPYPQMVREAIAGDLLPKPRLNAALGINESALGIGQLRMVLHGFSPTDSLDEMVTFTDNQIDVVTKAFQGLTVSCARCHNHKFDAISQADFYALYGIFTSTHPAVIDANLPDAGKAEREEMLSLKKQIRTAVGNAWKQQSAKLAPVVAKASPNPNTAPTPARSWDVRKQPWYADGKAVSQGPTPAGEFAVALSGDQVIERIHPSGVFTDLISTKERGVLMSPRFKCEGGTLWIRSAGAGGASAKYVVQNYPRTGTIHKAKEFKEAKEEKLGWYSLDLDYWKGDDIFIQCATAADLPSEFKLDSRSWFGITEAFVTFDKDRKPFEAEASGNPAEAITAWASGTVTDEQAKLLNHLLTKGVLQNRIQDLPAVAPLLKRYRDLEAKLPMPTRAPGVLEADGYDAPLYVRGDHKQPAELIPRRFLDGIDATPFNASNSGRLELAEKLVDPKNPFTSRIIVNRLWNHVFGRGLVSTPDNFGKLGEKPTHPELLDYLAERFTQSGGSMKEMIRLLVTSQTFQLADRASVRAAEVDPENKLLSHFSVRRLDAEAIRDSILSLSGRLDETMFGPSVDGNDQRRGVYLKIIRNNMDPFLTAFDAPVPVSTRGRRDSTNVPAQSLALLNSRNVISWSEKWAQDIFANNTLQSDEARISRMFQQAFGREPTADERTQTLAYLHAVTKGSTEAQQQLASQEKTVQKLQSAISTILEPARTALLKKAQANTPVVSAATPEPLAEWDFESGTEDLKKRLPLELQGKARVENGALILDGDKSFAASGSLPKKLHEKTLEAWVMLDDLQQRGGGVVTIQGKDGNVFDSIVFGEKDPACWVAGSDFFKRSELFDGPRESEAATRPVHVAVVYASDGTVTGYRDGKPYGRSYRKAAAETFEASDSQVLLGCRHAGGGGNRNLLGRIYRARIYDRALSAPEIARTSQIEGSAVTEKDVLSALSEDHRKQVIANQQQLAIETTRLQELRSTTGEATLGPRQAWASLAQSLINLKEFIYLK